MKGQKDYQNGKIYKIVNDTDKTYIGSSCSPLSKRLAEHRRTLRGGSKELINGTEEIILIHNFPCKNNDELRREERRIYDLFKARGENVLNQRLPYRTKEDMNKQTFKWRKDNPEQFKKLTRRYYMKHKEQIKEKEKKYREQNREKNRLYAKAYRERKKEIEELFNIDLSIFD